MGKWGRRRMLVQSWVVWTVAPSLPLSRARLLALLGPMARFLRIGGVCSACLSPGLKKQCRTGRAWGSRGGGGAGVGGYMVYPSQRAGLVLPYRLVLTLTPPCGPRACPRASPPFLVENRKLWLSFLHAFWEGQRRAHAPPRPLPWWASSLERFLQARLQPLSILLSSPGFFLKGGLRGAQGYGHWVLEGKEYRRC